MSLQDYHEEVVCPRRLVPCERKCGEWVPFSDLQEHMDNLCIKRPFPPLLCRLGCGAQFAGGAHRMLQSEEERLDHEQNLCDNRLVRCDWPGGCVAMIMAKNRRKHRQLHIQRTGIFVFTVAGTNTFVVPDATRQLKLQCWGGGGGSGHLYDRIGGAGGGGAYVEALLLVTPGEKLEITVGSGGSGGVRGLREEQREVALLTRTQKHKPDPDPNPNPSPDPN